MGPRLTASLALPLLLALSGCGMQSFELQRSQEIPPGPGLLTGPEGAFVISGPRRPASPPPASGGEPAGAPAR
jgi:hypothetical protein